MKLARLRGPHRRISSGAGLPYRIRVPLAKLQERKNLPREETRAPALGDGEQLESMDSAPDYVRLALTSRRLLQPLRLGRPRRQRRRQLLQRRPRRPRQSQQSPCLC